MLFCEIATHIFCLRKNEFHKEAIAKPFVIQRGACKDFIDLKGIMEKTGLAMDVLMHDIRRKYTVGEELLFQLKKSLLYFDDAERDLNVNVFSEKRGRLEPLSEEDWTAAKRYFENLVKQR